MMPCDSPWAAQPFFLQSGTDSLFCLFHPPRTQRVSPEYLIYVHPFAEEMNKSRRMASLQARRLADMGIGVLQVDLAGCGDSSGELRDARWENWMENLSCARRWLEQRTDAPIGLWGLRLGGLLALAFAHACRRTFGRIILWQPIVNGETYLGQFLRMRLASEMAGGGNGSKTSLAELRSALAAGQPVEVAGYELPACLAQAIDTLRAEQLAIVNCPVHWFELVPNGTAALPVPAARVLDAWQEKGVDVDAHLIHAASFWASQEIATCPDLLLATGRLYTGMHA